MEPNELQRKILRYMADRQCRETEGPMGEPQVCVEDDERPVVRYAGLEEELGVSRDRLKVEMHELRNEGLIELVQAVNYDYMPSGSGWFLTTKGSEIVNNYKLCEILSA